jgi:tRNA(Ile)-lysidine synthase
MFLGRRCWSCGRARGRLYHVAVHELAERVLGQVRRQELLHAGDRVGLAVSGGIDSVALLRLLLKLRHELGIVPSVVHFNHKLRGAESDADQEFVAGLARELGLEFYCESDDVAGHAAEEHVSVETAARELRYGFFRYLLGAEGGERNPAGDEARAYLESENRSAESAAPPQSETQGRRPALLGPFDGAAGSRALSKPGSALSDSSPERASSSRLSKIATGHTLDDQAETLLMRIIRGAGLRGLGGIHPRIAVEDDDGEISGEIVRPLLTIRRRELEQYLKDIGQPWREDSSNADERFTRNRVRKLVVPLLEREFNPAVAENLAELAEIARGEEDYWGNEIAGWMGTTVHWSEPDWARAVSSSNDGSLVQIAPLAAELRHPEHPPDSDLRERIDSAPWLVMNASVSRMWFLGEPTAVQRRLVKAIGEQAGFPLEFKHVEEILRLAAEDGSSGKALSLPLGWSVARAPEQLIFLTPDLRDSAPPEDYEYELSIPARVRVYETGSTIELRRTVAGVGLGHDAAYNAEHLLDAESLPGRLRVRNWRPGDRFWPAHTKSPKKIKELLQELRVAQPERRLWPVVVSGDEIVWMRGLLPPAKFRAKAGKEAILILETALSAEPAE